MNQQEKELKDAKEKGREEFLIELKVKDPAKYRDEIRKEKETVMLVLDGENALSYKKLMRNTKPGFEKYVVDKLMHNALGMAEHELNNHREMTKMKGDLNGMPGFNQIVGMLSPGSNNDDGCPFTEEER